MSQPAPLRKDDIVRALQQIGVRPGQVVLVHSAMRTLGPVEGGAATVVQALLEAVGPQGTLVAPTFTFYHEVPEVPVIDPAADRSEMGAITEQVRLHPAARRSVALRHSFAAVGPKAEALMDIDPSLSAFDERSIFGRMLEADTRILLLGVCYTSSTSHHFAEWVCQVPYRRTIPKQTKVRRPDGTLVDQPMVDYQPKPGAGGAYSQRSPDFNRLGRMLERQGKVGVGAVGNAMARLFPMRALIELAKVEAGRDYNVFRFAEGQESMTPLDDGQLIQSHLWTDGAGRPNRTIWSVVNEQGLYRREA